MCVKLVKYQHTVIACQVQKQTAVLVVNVYACLSAVHKSVPVFITHIVNAAKRKHIPALTHRHQGYKHMPNIYPAISLCSDACYMKAS